MSKKQKLREYEDKRDFQKTREPSGKARRKKKENAAPRFVVQEHSARRLHWDLRLEHEGVAASWAIPNGIPETPDENRKAVHTEDHPLEYLEFEGEIPAGEYGAGTMKIWDRGTYELEKWEEGKVVLSFHGERLSGRYALFRAGGERDWLIHRIDPPAERRDPFPGSIVPMLAKLAEPPARDDSWAVEVKWDGVRAIAYCQPGRLELQSRNLRDITAQYPEVRRLSRQLGSRDAVLDGELVAFDPEGRPSFERLQQRIHQTAESVVRRRMKEYPVTYVVFDLLYLDGRDLTAEPYRRRRELLEALELSGPSWQTPGRVLIDWSQNDPHKTTVCVYSLRAKERPTVSTPLEWEEVEEALAADDAGRLVFDHAAVLERVEAKGDLFAPLLSERQSFPEGFVGKQ